MGEVAFRPTFSSRLQKSQSFGIACNEAVSGKILNLKFFPPLWRENPYRVTRVYLPRNGRMDNKTAKQDGSKEALLCRVEPRQRLYRLQREFTDISELSPSKLA